MKTTATLIQQALEQKAIDSMIAYERNLISEQKMGKALTDALKHNSNVEGHRSIFLKGWIKKRTYALNRNQLNDHDRKALKTKKNEYKSQ